MTRDSDIREIRDHQDLEDLRAKYAHYIDDHRWEEWADLFVEDVTCKYPGWGTFDSREELLEMMKQSFESNIRGHTHFFHQPLLDVDGDQGTGIWYYNVFTAFTGDEDSPYPEGTAAWRQGRYVDEYRKVDGDWKFAAVEQKVESRRLFEYEVTDSEHFGEMLVYGPTLPTE